MTATDLIEDQAQALARNLPPLTPDEVARVAALLSLSRKAMPC